jgi:hypothetical protein
MRSLGRANPIIAVINGRWLEPTRDVFLYFYFPSDVVYAFSEKTSHTPQPLTVEIIQLCREWNLLYQLPLNLDTVHVPLAESSIVCDPDSDDA